MQEGKERGVPSDSGAAESDGELDENNYKASSGSSNENDPAAQNHGNYCSPNSVALSKSSEQEEDFDSELGECTYSEEGDSRVSR